jgi:elongation factor G
VKAEVARGIKLGIMNRSLYPVFCICKKNMGVGRLMEFIGTSGPSPVDVPAPKTTEGKEVKIDSKGPISVFVFKTSIEQHIGEINYFKVMSGELTEGTDLTNNNSLSKERIAQLLVVAGKTRNKIEKIVAGDLGATVKLKNTKFNQTLSASNNDFTFEPIPLEPCFRTAIKAVSENDEKLGEALIECILKIQVFRLNIQKS